MASTYKTPGVFVEEISKFPPSVAEVETAIPAFIGYTEKAMKDGKELINPVGGKKIITPVRIKSLLEYEIFFGGDAKPKQVEVHLKTGNKQVEKVDLQPKFYLYNSLRLFFDNGGGPCFIIPIGLYKDDQGNDVVPNLEDFKSGRETIKKLDEPTLLIAPDAVNLDPDKLGNLQQLLLQQCADLGDRFTIMDLAHNPTGKRYESGEIEVFRNSVGAMNMPYGAAYFPWLRTTYSYTFNFGDIVLADNLSFKDLLPNSPIIGEVGNIFDDIEENAPLHNTIFDRPNLDPPGSILEGYALIEPAIDEANMKAELEKRATYLRAVIKSFIDLNSDLKDAENASKVYSKDAKSAKQLHDEILEPGDSTAPEKTFGKLEQQIRRLILLDIGHPNSGDLATRDPLGIAVNGTDYFNTSAFTYDTAFDESTQEFLDAVASVYGTSDAYGDRVRYAREHFFAIYQAVISTILNFREQLIKRAENLEKALEASSSLYYNILQAIRQQGILLPPSGAIAGIYAAIDNTRGVWKAPANVSLTSVVGPTVVLDDSDQDGLNVDANAGKSVNAIRAFRGKGTIVWGARTLAGNDNEWRYISVRRFFNMVEESVKKSTAWAVFEPNDANTWVKVKGMIENYLTNLWRQGALQGGKKEQAFFVNVGLGQTMTAIDILEGRMIVEIGMAVVRPAEFIILRFMHKMPES